MTPLELQQLIERFWAGEASAQERRTLLKYLDRHRELRATLYQVYGRRDREVGGPLVGRLQANEWLQKIHHRAGIGAAETYFRPRAMSMRWVAAAALLILSLCTGLALYIVSDTFPSSYTQHAAVQQPAVYRNTGTETMQILLPDSSVVYLAPNSEVCYSTDYNHTTRSLNLKGKGQFKVTPDKHKPFTVYANGFATTALGTEFVVSTQQTGIMMVRLLSGKVVVRATASAPFKLTNTYLKPGDELCVNVLEETLSLVHKSTPQVSSVGHTPTKRTANSVSLQFYRTPLLEVFQRLEAAKGVPIHTTKADLNGLSFSGVFLPTDSPDTILSIICTMNDLTYRYEDDHVVIINK